VANISPYSFESPFSEQDGDLNETPRTARGLKYLTTLVKTSIPEHEPTSYMDVARDLINDLTCNTDADRIKEEKNVRRRVYDAINVLIAAGILQRDGKMVQWRKNVSYSKEETENKLQKIEEK
jgi:transcription factor Dp-1